MTGARNALRLAALAALLLCFSALAQADPPDPSAYDTYLRSDYGGVKLWLNTTTGDFFWEDLGRNLKLSARGTLEFPNLGPIILTFGGPLPGYDWVSVSLKIIGTSATGVMAVFPEGEPARKVVSNFYDKNTADDLPRSDRTKAPAPKPKPPKVEGVQPSPKEVPLPPKP